MSVRVLLQQLAHSGWRIRTFCGPLLDFCRDEDVRQILADAKLEVRQDIARYGDGDSGRLLTFQNNGVDSSVFLPADTAQVTDTRLWGHVYLEHYVRVLNDFRPEVVLTYGGDHVAASLLQQARQREIATVFWLQNLAYL